MKQQQAQMQGPLSPARPEPDVEAVAMRNFEARNPRGDRAWRRDHGSPEGAVFPLSERERAEFIEQARHEIEMRASQHRTRSGRS